MLEHGANPGLISHFTKQGLLDIGKRLLEGREGQGRATPTRSGSSSTDQTFNRLAMKLGVKVIHCSERDTQITDQPKQVDEFVNTWSIEGFREEGTTTAEMGWGTHEKELPAAGLRARRRPAQPDLPGPHGHEHLGALLGAQLLHPRHGRPPRRGLHDLRPADRLGGRQGRSTGPRSTTPTARATAAIASLNELRGYDYELQPKLRIMNDEITSGSDILGALLMGHAYNSWWTGSDLSIEESRRLVPHQNATTMQVAISVVAAAHVDDREPRAAASACPTTCRTSTC